MKCFFIGGPFDHRELQVSKEYARLHRLEVRVTSDGDTPIPRGYQPVAVYARRYDRSFRVREFIGMADQP